MSGGSLLGGSLSRHLCPRVSLSGRCLTGGGGSLSKGVSVWGESLSRGVSVQGIEIDSSCRV